MEENNEISNAIAALYYQAKEQFGDEVESLWFYDSEICPCCGKHKINKLVIGDKNYVSFNSFMYHDMKVLITYLLCNKCAVELPGTSKKQKLMYENLDQKLKEGYLNHIKTSAS